MINCDNCGNRIGMNNGISDGGGGEGTYGPRLISLLLYGL
jgi:hypothetical protein